MEFSRLTIEHHYPECFFMYLFIFFIMMHVTVCLFVHRVFVIASCIVPSPESLVHPSSCIPCCFAPCFVLLLCFCVVHHYSFFYFHIFLFFLSSLLPSTFPFVPPVFSTVASLTASVHAPSGPVPTETQFPWKQIHQELQVTNHAPAKCHRWNDRVFFYIFTGLFIYLVDQTQ